MIGRWSPPFATHVEAWSVSTPEEGEPTRIDMTCLVCGALWRIHCYSGRWDKRVEKFAILHMKCWYSPLPTQT